MVRASSEIAQNEELNAPPPLGPELASGKWKVHVIDDDGNITVEKVSGKQVWSMQNRRVMVDFNRKGQPIKDSGGLLGSWLGSLSNDLNILPINYTDWRKVSGKQVWSMQNRRVMVDFNRKGQPIKDSGGLLGSWLGSLSNDLNILPINYTDWRKVSEYRKEMAWKLILKKFWFDDPTKRRKYVIFSLGTRCRDLKTRLWKDYRRNTLKEALEARPGLIPEDQWMDFVHFQFTDKAKKVRARNTESRSKLNIPHALGKKSLARKAYEMEDETGVEPSRGEIFIASRMRSDGSMICEEARVCAEKLKEAMNQKIPGQTSNNDAFAQIFGPEHPGRV